jgi:tryptophan-rich sensory protein
MKIPFGGYAVASGLIGGFLTALISFMIVVATNTLGYTNSALLADYLIWYAVAGFFAGMCTVYIVLKDINGRGVLRRKPRPRNTE